jgi:hypothetical protein
MSLWIVLCLVFFYLDKDIFYTRKVLPNQPLEIATEEEIMEMVEEKLGEKKTESPAAYTTQQKKRTKLYKFTIRQLLTELAFRIRQP